PAVRQAADLGFTHIDAIARIDRPHEDLEVLAESGLLVSCTALGHGLPDGHMLDAPSVATRQATLEAMRRQVTDTARLGATHAYVTPGHWTDTRTYFAESCCLLADYAAQCRVRLCVEPIPGRALPSAAAVLNWLTHVHHDQLGLLLDVGHSLISGEDPAQVV